VTRRWERVSNHFHLFKLKQQNKMRHTASLAAAYGKNSRRFIVGGNAKANLTQAEASVSFFWSQGPPVPTRMSHTRLLSVILFTDLIVSVSIYSPSLYSCRKFLLS
jgi:hypothetical protein